MHGIKYRAAWNRYKAGKIPGAYLDEYGRIVVPDPVSELAHVSVVYARVSTHKQKDDLERQAQRMIEFANARGLSVAKVVKEVASGVNDTRPKLTAVLKDDSWGTLVVEHKDRLSRVGFHWFETLLGVQGKTIVVANLAEEHTADLMEDFVAIIYSFAARMYGLRGSKQRARRIIQAAEEAHG